MKNLGFIKYIKLILAGLMVIVAACQNVIYGFLGSMIVWLILSLGYLAIGLFQRFHGYSVCSQILSIIYISVPLSALTIYAITSGLSKLTLTFYIIFLILLSLSLVWEIVSLCLFICENKR